MRNQKHIQIKYSESTFIISLFHITLLLRLIEVSLKTANARSFTLNSIVLLNLNGGSYEWDDEK